MSPASFAITLTMVIATLSVPCVQGYTYYYYVYYYYNQQPSVCTSSYYNPNSIKTCPISSCHCTMTNTNCCLRYFTYNNVLYHQCICSSYTTCAPTYAPIDNPPPQTTQATTTPTTPTTSTTSTTPTTSTTSTTTTPTTSTTTTPTTTTPTTTSTTTTPTTTSTTTTPTTTSTTTTPTTTSTTTTPSTTTSTTTTSTTTTPTTTTPTTTSTTTTPTTTTSSTTTSTTTTPTTTPAFRSLCDSSFRLLNGESISDCDFKGIANITTMNGTLAICNAVYAHATVNGVYKPTFITATLCTDIIESESNMTFELQIGKQKYPIIPILFKIVKGKDGASFIDMHDNYAKLLSDLGCQKEACPYNKATMEGKVDFNDCEVAGYGAADADTFESEGVQEVKIALNPGGCTNIEDSFGAANTLCFKSISGSSLTCARDTGSAITCKAPSNGEDILVAISALQPDCDSSSELKGIPYPG